MLAITSFFVGLFALLQIPLTVMVGFRRVQTGIQFLDGGDQTLMRRMRAHGNFTETVPITLAAMAAAELAGAPHWLLWIGGLLLLVGRSLHLFTLVRSGWGLGRAAGMILTFIPMAGFGLIALARTFPIGG
jgi:uncharacterized protein